tara:strand:- start:194 stop:1195 length:1002 start_codon:yes stop_codon:yes gene_type:complete
MYDKENSSKYRRIFRDVVRGYSIVNIDNQPFYIKHLTVHDQVDLEDIEEQFYEKARKRGIPTEKESLKDLINDGMWKKEDDDFIERQQSYLENLVKGKGQLILKSQLDKQDSIIEEETKKLEEKINEKNNLLGNTCEKYARQRINDHYILKSFFKDRKFKEEVYDQKEFDELSYSEISKFIKVHNELFTLFSEENIQKLILEDFFFPYMPFSEDTMQFFGFPVCKLTQHQLKLILFTRVFKSIFDNNENIPDKIRKDPKALMDFASAGKKGREELDKHEEKGGASTIVGASKEDYEYMGVDSSNVQQPETLTQAAKKKGGSLNMNDLMDMHGV